MHHENNLLELINEIENIKIKLNNLICEKQYDLTDLDVIKLSEKLDELLSEYHNIK